MTRAEKLSRALQLRDLAIKILKARGAWEPVRHRGRPHR